MADGMISEVAAGWHKLVALLCIYVAVHCLCNRQFDHCLLIVIHLSKCSLFGDLRALSQLSQGGLCPEQEYVLWNTVSVPLLC